MPTGYTAGILDGPIKTFKQFATICMRAFGATIHMRDENISKMYVPRTPDKYYYERIEKEKKELEDFKNLSDEEIIKTLKKNLLDEQKRCKKQMAEKLEALDKLNAIYADVSKWTPPTKEHHNFKQFMKEQLSDTISSDGDISYYAGELNKVQEQLLKIQDETQHVRIADEYRTRMITDAEHNIRYYTVSYEKEMERCNDSNKWVEDLLKSIK